MTAVNLNRAIRGPVTAVPIVAGKGVRLVADTQNNRWVVEVDETTLWEDTDNSWDSSFTLSENASNFEYIEILYTEAYENEGSRTIRIPTAGKSFSSQATDIVTLEVPFYYNGRRMARGGQYTFSSPTTLSLGGGYQLNVKSVSTSVTDVTMQSYYSATANRQTSVWIKKIVGVNRIASN